MTNGIIGGKYILENGTVFNINKEILYFSTKRFIDDIVNGNCCFICGARPDSVSFNDEHILPDWILRKYNLYSRTITIPNLMQYRYDQYKIPCCVRCNSLMGEEIEKPISILFQNNYVDIVNILKKEGIELLFKWLCLIFIKTHLKDKHLRYFLDKRKANVKIADLHDWEPLQHIHCISRSFYTNAVIDNAVFGTMLIIPATLIKDIELFDYGDISSARTMFIRMNDTVVFTVFDDSCICGNAYNKLKNINGSLSPIQIRELMCRLAHINMNIITRPKYYSDFKEKYYIKAALDKDYEIGEVDFNLLGELMYRQLHEMLKEMKNDDIEQIIQHVKKGQYTFLFNEKGEFNGDSLIIRDKLNR